MVDFASLLERLGSLTDTASALRVSVQAVSNMKARNKVGPNHWPRLIELAAEKQIEGVTFETLSAAYARSTRQPEAIAS